MFYLPLSKIVDSAEVAVAPGAMVHAEAQALTRQPGNQAAGVGASQGIANEIFCGFAIAGTSAAPFLETFDNKVEHFVVPAGGNVKLQMTPVAGQFNVYDETAGSADADATCTGNVVSGLTVGNTVKVTYKYEMNATQIRAKMGDIQPGGYVGNEVNQLGCAKRGLIYTGEFDASVDWANVTAIKLGANGQLVASGAGVTITGFVTHLPTADIPYLGVEFSAV